MSIKINFLNSIGHGVEMNDGTSPFDYFDRYFEIKTFDTVKNIYTNEYYNELGITKVVQTISRVTDEVVIRFWAEDELVVRVDGVYTDAGRWSSYDIEKILDQLSPWEHTEIIGTKYRDVLYSNPWEGSEISGRGGRDKIFGDSKADRLHGDNGNDIIKAGGGKDEIQGGRGNDRLWGDSGHDSISGGDGNDKIFGGWGNDTLSGGSGADIFAFKRSDHNYAKKDVITDFEIGQDGIQFIGRISSKHVTVKQIDDDTVILVKTGYFDSYKILVLGIDAEELVDSGSIEFI